MFASRRYGHLQDRFQDSLDEPGRQIVLYGDTGVGKTSLVRHICEAKGVSLVSVECGQPFEEMLKEALAKAGVTEDTFEGVETTDANAGVRGSLGILFAGGKHSLSDSIRSSSYPVSIQTAAREALTAVGVEVLFIDNFENLRAKAHGRETAIEIAHLLKSCSDRDESGVKVVVAGIPSESEALLALDAATGRRTSEIEVPRMPDAELDEILRKGEEKLDIDFDADCRALIIRYSDGFPFYTHLHALHATRAAFRDHESRVSVAHFTGALDRILIDTGLSLKRTYDNAAETTGTVRTRKTIMEAIARLEKQEVTFREVKASFWKIHPDYPNLKALDFISPHLSELVEKYHVLQSRGIPRSVDRTYRFANPLMRAYVRLRAEQDKEPQMRFGER